jgi:DNA-directed RNA polymerase sigma subunit (sigma70/sigma32)
MWIDYKKEFNCCLETVEKNGALTLREIADRLGVSFVRVKQIQDKALEKLNKSAFNNLIY